MTQVATQIEVWPYCDLDRAGVVKLWRAVFPQAKPHNAPDLVITRKLAQQRGLFFVALAGDEVVGTVLAGYDGVRGWLYRLAVAPRYRRQGIGKSLVAHAVRALKAMGCAKVNLQVEDGNDEAVVFYESLGFGVEPRVSLGLSLESKR